MRASVLPKTPEQRAALRTAIATVLAIVLAFALHLDKPYWSGMTVVVLANLYTGNILDKAIMRLLGTFLGAWSGFFLAGFIANSFFLYFLINFFIITTAVYYYNSSKYAYAWLMAAISAFIVISELAINPDDAFYVAVWRPIEICLGVLVSAATAFCVFPNAISHHITQEAKTIFTAVDELLVTIEQWLISGDSEFLVTIAADNSLLKKKIRQAQDMIDVMRRETGITRKKIEEFRVLLDCFFNLTRNVHYFISTLPDKYRDTNLPINDFFSLIRQDLFLYQQSFFGDKQNNTLVQSTAMADFDARLIQIRQSSAQYTNANLSTSHFLRQISLILAHLQNNQAFNKPKQWINSTQQLRLDPDSIVHSIKAGLSAILALAFWLVSNWPGGLTGIVSSIIISIRRNLFEMTHIGTHRFIGCLLGAVVFFSFVFFFALDLYAFVFILFISVWAFSLLSFKHPSYAYIGLQANIALIIAMAQEGGSPIAISTSLERLSGVIIGIVASFLVANLLWRTDLLTMLQRQLQTLSTHLHENCRQWLAPEGYRGKFYDVSDTFWLCRGLLESLEQQPLNQHRKEQLTKALATRDALLRVQIAFINSYQAIDQQQARQTAKMIGIDLVSIEQEIAVFFKESNSKLIPVISASLQNAQMTLLATINNKQLPLIDAENCLVYLKGLLEIMQQSYRQEFF